MNAEMQVARETFLEACTTFSDDGLAAGTLKQCALEIHVLLMAIDNGCSDSLARTVLTGIAMRMEAAAVAATSDRSRVGEELIAGAERARADLRPTAAESSPPDVRPTVGRT